jgi:hypothetical protein
LLLHNITTDITTEDREGVENIAVYAATLRCIITTDVKKKRGRGADHHWIS